MDPPGGDLTGFDEPKRGRIVWFYNFCGLEGASPMMVQQVLVRRVSDHLLLKTRGPTPTSPIQALFRKVVEGVQS